VPLRILIADDHRLLRAGLRALLKTEPQIEVVGEAGDGDEALALANSLNPDIILADISMPGPSGIDIARELKEQSSEIRVLILTMHEDDLLARDALQAGASGYLVKRAAESDLVAAIQTVAEGGTYIDESLRPSAHEADAAQAPTSPEPAVELTPAERDVLRALAQGKPNQQVAEELHLTADVLAEIRARLAEKLGAHSRLELIAHARRMSLL
jgi:two-component system response regulator NreC